MAGLRYKVEVQTPDGRALAGFVWWRPTGYSSVPPAPVKLAGDLLARGRREGGLALETHKGNAFLVPEAVFSRSVLKVSIDGTEG